MFISDLQSNKKWLGCFNLVRGTKVFADTRNSKQRRPNALAEYFCEEKPMPERPALV
ncbi:hypothetical protein [Phyllobacterium bourgognense]|uniref:hypothetical protein n=1 Tax=Phyllobacterium bourgognense TaxID=314236 RepID=UPI0015F0F520|nr:hypothetical protein [Phyllobacterium bourgognense]